MRPRILVALDESDASNRAAELVNRLFRDVDAEVLGINVVPVPTSWMLGVGVGAGGDVWPFAFEDRIARESDRVITESGLETDGTLSELGDPVSAVIDAAQRRDVDLVVVGASDKGWWSRLLDGSVTQGVLRESGRAVLVVP
jgi:nucleotide-binding universal stress UspA family protein